MGELQAGARLNKMAQVAYKGTSEADSKYIQQLQSQIDKLRVENAVYTQPVMIDLTKTYVRFQTILNGVNINAGASNTQTFSVNSNAQIRELVLTIYTSPLAASTTIDIQANSQPVEYILVFPVLTSVQYVTLERFTGLRENGDITYSVTLTNNSGNNVSYYAYLTFYLLPIETIGY